MEKSKKYTAVFLLMLLVGWLYYESLPNFHIRHSFVKISDSSVETTLDVITYKMFNNAELYQEIANEHNRINGIPNTSTPENYISFFSSEGIFEFFLLKSTGFDNSFGIIHDCTRRSDMHHFFAASLTEI